MTTWRKIWRRTKRRLLWIGALKMTRDVHDRILTLALRDAPKEACGVIGGKWGVARKCYPMRNVDPEPLDHYMTTPVEGYVVLREMAEDRLHPMGIWHSHPRGPASMSNEDIRYAVDPATIYIIVSPKGKGRKRIRAFRAKQGRAKELRIIVV
jgi:proteasome lid subunit RPN8/RPN11